MGGGGRCTVRRGRAGDNRPAGLLGLVGGTSQRRRPWSTNGCLLSLSIDPVGGQARYHLPLADDPRSRASRAGSCSWLRPDPTAPARTRAAARSVGRSDRGRDCSPLPQGRTPPPASADDGAGGPRAPFSLSSPSKGRRDTTRHDTTRRPLPGLAPNHRPLLFLYVGVSCRSCAALQLSSAWSR